MKLKKKGFFLSYSGFHWQNSAFNLPEIDFTVTISVQKIQKSFHLFWWNINSCFLKKNKLQYFFHKSWMFITIYSVLVYDAHLKSLNCVKLLRFIIMRFYGSLIWFEKCLSVTITANYNNSVFKYGSFIAVNNQIN